MIKYLVIGPGGQGLFAMLGHLKKIEDQLVDVQEISGASAGSIIGFFMCSGRSISEILDLMLSVDVPSLTKLNLNVFLNSYGFIDQTQIREKLVELYGSDPTFSDVLPKKLWISALCVNTGRTEYFSADTHPTMKITEAVCMSISVPVLMAGYKFKGHIYADGGTIESFPGQPFLHKLREEVLCVCVKSNLVTESVQNFKDYLTAIISAYHKGARVTFDLPCFTVDVGNMNLLDMNMCHEDKLRMYLLGFIS